MLAYMNMEISQVFFGHKLNVVSLTHQKSLTVSWIRKFIKPNQLLHPPGQFECFLCQRNDL